MGMNDTLKAISDPVRRDILQMLKVGRKSAGEIAEKFNLTGATVSYHLTIIIGVIYGIIVGKKG